MEVCAVSGTGQSLENYFSCCKISLQIESICSLYIHWSYKKSELLSALQSQWFILWTELLLKWKINEQPCNPYCTCKTERKQVLDIFKWALLRGNIFPKRCHRSLGQTWGKSREEEMGGGVRKMKAGVLSSVTREGTRASRLDDRCRSSVI